MAILDRIEAELSKLPSVASVEVNRERSTLTALARDRGDPMTIRRDVGALADNGAWKISGLQQDAGHLDEVFRNITQGAVA